MSARDVDGVTAAGTPWWGTGDPPVGDATLWSATRVQQFAYYDRLAAYASRWPAEDGEDQLSACELSVSSQNGEDGVIAEIVRRIGAVPHTFVEFGVETGAEGNCVALADVRGWTGWFLESDAAAHRQLAAKYAHNARVHTAATLVTPPTVDEIFAGLGVPAQIGVLSVDIDGDDWAVWRALTVTRPRVVVIEYNSALPPQRPLVPRTAGTAWDGTQNFGSSLGALMVIAQEKAYDLVHLESCGVNAFFVDRTAHWAGPVNEAITYRTPNYFMSRSQHPGFDPTLAAFMPLGTDRADDHTVSGAAAPSMAGNQAMSAAPHASPPAQSGSRAS